MKIKKRTETKTFALMLLALLLFCAATVFASPGDLDAAFGVGGKVVSNFPGNFYPRKIAIQPDGKIVVQGEIYIADYTGSFLVRYNPNGTLDTGFGHLGLVEIPYQSPSYEFFTKGLAILPDGKILVSGVANNPAFPSSPAFAVFRFNGNGSRDASFGTNGVAVWSFNLENYREDYAITLKVQPDGKIVVVGYLSNNCNSDPLCFTQGFAFIRFNADGSLDSTFGTNGVFRIPPSEPLFVDDFVILPNGKILMIGSVFVTGNDTVVFLRRINANGTPDASFGTNGVVRPGINESVDIYQLTIQTDGKIVFPVHNNRVSPTRTTIVRLNPDGAFDASFGINGKVVISNTEGLFHRSILIQPNGKILAGGGALTGRTSRYRFAILRLNPDGNRDATFGVNGIVTTLMDSYGGEISDLALQPDDKLVVCGKLQNDVEPDVDIGLARYLLNTPSPTRFDFDGDRRADISVFRPSDATWYLNLSTQGFSVTQFGISTDETAPADFDGDGKTDIAVFREGAWYWLNSSDGNFNAVQFGRAGDIPLPADFDGDGRAELAIYRSGVWFTLNLTNNQSNAVQFGVASDKPVVGDYDGDLRADYAVYRNGVWYLLGSREGFAAIRFGIAGDKLVPADYDADGKADLAVYRGGVWYLQQSSQGFTAFQFGVNSDIPAPADYDGDGKTDAAVYRDGVWYLRQTTGGFSAQQFGLPNDKPVPAVYLP